MNVAFSALFAFAGLFSIIAMSRAIIANLPAIRQLRRQLALPGHGSEVTVNFLEPAGEWDALSAVRRPRHVRVPAPKPVTHRLHHFAKARHIA